MQSRTHGEVDIEGWLNGSPFHRLLGIALISVDSESGALSLLLPFNANVERAAESGQVHGGAIGALVDVAGTFALIAALSQPVPTMNLRVDYLRPAISTDLIANAVVRRAGKSVGIVDVEVVDSQQRTVALGRGSFSTHRR